MADNQLRITEVPNGLVVAGVRLDEKVVTKADVFRTGNQVGRSGADQRNQVYSELEADAVI